PPTLPPCPTRRSSDLTRVGVPSICGSDGPNTSASSMPTRAPQFCRARARFTATVLLPTPPLPDVTAITFFTPGRRFLSAGGGSRSEEHTSELQSRVDL